MKSQDSHPQRPYFEPEDNLWQGIEYNCASEKWYVRARTSTSRNSLHGPFSTLKAATESRDRLEQLGAVIFSPTISSQMKREAA